MSIIASFEGKCQEKTPLQGVCALCAASVASTSILHENLLFCCHGCLAVYRILEAKNELSDKEGHPLIRQAVEWGVISNPELIEKIRLNYNKNSTSSAQWSLEIEGMWCPSCADLIYLIISQKKGVQRVHVDYITDIASIHYNPLEISKETLKSLISSLGYPTKEFDDQKISSFQFTLTLRFAVAAFCALNVMMFAYPLYASYFDDAVNGVSPMLAWVSFGLTIPVITYSAFPVYKRFWNQCKHGTIAMEALVVIGCAAAILLSLIEMAKGTQLIYFDTVTVLITFLLLGKIIESKAKFSTKVALSRLHQALPRKGRKLCTDGAFRFVPLKEIALEDQLVAYAGERIVLDGVVVEGEGACDEAVITGEAVPVFKRAGDGVLSGTVLQNGRLFYRVVSLQSNSALQKIVSLVVEEIGNKCVYVRTADRVVQGFVPVVIAIAAFTLIFTFAFGAGFTPGLLNAIAVLLIACPCAIGIAAPLVEARMIQQFVEKGAIVRNRACLGLLPKITHFIFDKTGTITQGNYQVLSGLEALNQNEKEALKGLVSQSLHPVSQAIDKALNLQGVSFENICELPGRGIRGVSNNIHYALGSAAFAKESGISLNFPTDAVPAAYFLRENTLLAKITLGDTVRPEANKMLQGLDSSKRFLLSGDRCDIVQKLSDSLAFDGWQGELSPLQKQTYIADLKKQKAIVAMMGDGINDAPALATADVGISLVTATDISIHVSDLLLTSDKLTTLPELVRIATRGQKIVRQNLFWAFAYNLIGIGLAVFGLLTPLFASFAMIASSLFVLFNSKRA